MHVYINLRFCNFTLESLSKIHEKCGKNGSSPLGKIII